MNYAPSIWNYVSIDIRFSSYSKIIKPRLRWKSTLTLISTAATFPPVEEQLKESFAEVLKELRAEKGLSQQALCDLANMEQVVLSRIERKVSLPSMLTLFKLAKALGVQPSEVLKRIEKKVKSK